MKTDSRGAPAAPPAGPTAPVPPSRKSILVATGAALLAAALVLVIAILPAEYGIDPLGTGRLLGLTALAEAGSGALVAQSAEHRLDRREFTLGPFQSVEYKYRIEAGGSMLYSWTATGLVLSEMHSEPDGAPEGYAETFDKQKGTGHYGTYTAPFPGIHGWYWENVDKQDVTITLITAGFYDKPQEFFSGGVTVHELTDLRGHLIQKAPK